MADLSKFTTEELQKKKDDLLKGIKSTDLSEFSGEDLQKQRALLMGQTDADRTSITQHPLLQALGGAGRAAVAMPAAAGQELAQLLMNLNIGASNIPRRAVGAQPLEQYQVPEAPGRSTLPGRVGGILGDIIGYGGTAAAMGPLGLAESLTPLGEQAAIGSVYGAIQSPQAPEKGAIIGGLAGGALHLGGVGSGKIAQAAAKRAEVVYPQARASLDNMLTRLRGSSSKETSAQDIYDRAAQHFEELKGSNQQGDISGIGQWIQPEDSIRAAYEKPKDISRELGIKIDMKPYLDKMNKYKGAEVAKYARFGEETLPADVKEYLEERLFKPNVKTFEEADLAKQNLNDEFGRFKPDDPRRHLVLEAKEGLRDSVRKSTTDSIDENIKKLTSENKEANVEEIESLKNKKESISKLWEEADRRYKEELLPFKKTPGKKVNTSPFYNRYAKGRPISGMVEEYVKPGTQKDQSELLENILHMMPDEESKNLIAYHHFRNEEGDPSAFIKKYMKLGENQKNVLFNEKDKATLDNFSKLHESNPDLFKEPAKKGKLESIFSLGRQAAGVGGIAGGHPVAGAAILGYPLLKRLALGTTGRFAETEAATALSPATRALIMSQILKERGNK